MQFSHKNIVTRIGVLVVISLAFTSCLKKIDADEDTLNTNIFDREYGGEQWYVINGIEQISNDLGEIKARIYTAIPEENVPDLKPSNIAVHVEAEDFEVTVLNYFSAGNGDYEKTIDLPYVGVGTYCITLGIYVAEEDISINLFEDCITLEQVVALG